MVGDAALDGDGVTRAHLPFEADIVDSAIEWGASFLQFLTDEDAARLGHDFA